MTSFDPPGPGTWMRLTDHFPGTLTLEYRSIYAATVGPGIASYMARYGVLARGLDVQFVNDHPYIAPVPLVGPRQTRRTPPAVALWLVARLHPSIRRRTKAARDALRERPWRAETTRWFEVERATWVARAQAVQDVEPDALGDAALAEHILACRALAFDGYARHFHMHGDDLLPIGLLVARCAELGIDAASALATLDGGHATGTGIGVIAEWQLVTGYDLDSLAACELTRARPLGPPAPRAASATTDLPAGTDDAHRDEICELVADARDAVPLRDDNGAVVGAWPMGLLRRAMLSAGRRLGIEPATLAVEATVDELVLCLGGASTPTTADLHARRLRRAANDALDPPDVLGPALSIPPLRALPRPLALMTEAQLAISEHMRSAGRAVGVGTRSYTGRALVVDDPGAALDQLEPGDIIVTRATCPAWNVVLSFVGGLVTTHGGVMSHAAVLARELKIPAVLGWLDATTSIRTGDIVEVDPRMARVRHVAAMSPEASPGSSVPS